MKIITRDGTTETVRLDAITDRIKKAVEYCGGLSPLVDPVRVAVKVVSTIRDNITTSELDDITAKICMNWSLEHPDWGLLGSRIIINNHQKNTKLSFYNAIKNLYNNEDSNGNPCPLVSDEVYSLVINNPDLYNTTIKGERDFLLDYFGFKTLEKSYLLKTSDSIIQETPQYLLLRVALGIWGKNTEKVIKTYDILSQKYATHATPTLFNAGTQRPGMLSCFDENTLVDTLVGPKRIVDVCIGDEVITHKGNSKRVVQIHKNEVNERQVYKLNIYKTPQIVVTGNHRFWTINKKIIPTPVDRYFY